MLEGCSWKTCLWMAGLNDFAVSLTDVLICHATYSLRCGPESEESPGCSQALCSAKLSIMEALNSRAEIRGVQENERKKIKMRALPWKTYAEGRPPMQITSKQVSNAGNNERMR